VHGRVTLGSRRRLSPGVRRTRLRAREGECHESNPEHDGTYGERPPHDAEAWHPARLWSVLSRSGLIALLHRLDMEHRKPKTVSRKLDPQKQAAFIRAYEDLLNHLDADEAILFVDAVHPTHAVRPVGCWAPKDTPIAVTQTSGRQRLNIHGAIDLETGQTRMLEVETVDAASTIRLMMALLTMYPRKRVIHLFLDNARYHHAKLVQAWLARSGFRIRLHFIPTYCPHLDPIERLWGLMHRNVTHNRCHATFADFSSAILTFLRQDVPRNWHRYCDQVTDNFRIIAPTDFRILA
jgi:transposase